MIYEAFSIPVEEFGDPESTNLSTIMAARAYHDRDMATFQYKYFTRQETISHTDLFLMQCKHKYSAKIYHNIERRIRREQARVFRSMRLLFMKSIYQQLEDIMVRGNNL